MPWFLNQKMLLSATRAPRTWSSSFIYRHFFREAVLCSRSWKCCCAPLIAAPPQDIPAPSPNRSLTTRSQPPLPYGDSRCFSQSCSRCISCSCPQTPFSSPHSRGTWGKTLSRQWGWLLCVGARKKVLPLPGVPPPPAPPADSPPSLWMGLYVLPPALLEPTLSKPLSHFLLGTFSLKPSCLLCSGAPLRVAVSFPVPTEL